MIRFWTKLLLAVVISSTVACKEETHVPPQWGIEDPADDREKNEDIVKLGWTNVGDTFGKLPNYISVYKSPSTLQNKQAIAYIAVADMTKATFDVLGDIGYDATAGGYGGKSVNTLTQFYEKNNRPIIINAGLFYYANAFYFSQNLVVRNGVLLAPNQNYYSKDWVTMWYPTLGAFSQMQDNSFKVSWTYFTSDKVNYSYNKPAPNDINKTPLQVPNATFPETATVLNAKTAIGGVGVLLKDGDVKNTYVEEMLDVSSTSNQPRTAIGIRADKKMVLFVCEGRNVTPGVAGLTTLDVANVMKALGCVDALNLDGGGSSGMLVNGKETIKPSGGTQRAVLTGVSLH